MCPWQAAGDPPHQGPDIAPSELAEASVSVSVNGWKQSVHEHDDGWKGPLTVQAQGRRRPRYCCPPRALAPEQPLGGLASWFGRKLGGCAPDLSSPTSGSGPRGRQLDLERGEKYWGACLGQPSRPPSEIFVFERTLENFFRAISSYPDTMSSSKTQGWVTGPGHFCPHVSQTLCRH